MPYLFVALWHTENNNKTHTERILKHTERIIKHTERILNAHGSHRSHGFCNTNLFKFV